MRRWIEALGKAGFSAEIGTDAGRVNLIGMILSLVASGLAGSVAVFESLVRVFRPEYTSGQPWAELFVCFLLFQVVCVSLLGALELARSKR